MTGLDKYFFNNMIGLFIFIKGDALLGLLSQICLGDKHRCKKSAVLLLVAIPLFISCNSEDASDCIQTSGDRITRSVSLPTFTKVRIDNDVSIEITQGDTQQITVQTRENLWSDLVFFVEGDTFIAQNNNDCNFFREALQTTVKLTTPNLVNIKNNSFGEVRSNGTLSFPNLRLESTTTAGLSSVNKSGDFILNVACTDFRVVANGNSDFFISGTTDTANIIFSDEFPLFQGDDFLIQDLTFRHVGAAAMIVHPINSITGEIRATGDVIARNEPPTVAVQEFFTGQLIFED